MLSFLDVQVIAHNTPYSHRKEIKWTPIGIEAAGTYECRANVIKLDHSENKTWELTVVPTQIPKIEDTNIEIGKVFKLPVGEPLQLRCSFTGIPHPTISWHLNDDVVIPDNSRIELLANNTVLNIHNVKRDDEGTYRCIGRNRVGTTSFETKLEITGN